MKSKTRNIKYLLLSGLLAGSFSITSCDDFLTIIPSSQIPEESFFQDKGDLENVVAAAYDKLTQDASTAKIMYWGEYRADNLELNTTSNTNIANLKDAILQPSSSMFDWSAFYSGIGFCNLVIEKGAEMTEPGKEVDQSFSQSDYYAIRTEMYALRSLYYFYLVRAYRDVPYVTKSFRTDAEAMNEAPAAQSGVAILGDCIKLLEDNIQYGAENYGDNASNKGRFTKTSIRALLADMYLWRAALLKDYRTKGYDGKVNLDDDDDAPIDNATCNTLSTECLTKADEYASKIIADMDSIRKKDILENPATYSKNKSEYETQPYPLLLNSTDYNTTVSDEVYSQNFSTKNSAESILELQYDGTTTTNGTAFFSSFSGGSFTVGTMVLSNDLLSEVTSVNASVGFGKTDFRLWETCYYRSVEARKPLVKFVLNNLSFSDTKDLTQASSELTVNVGGRESSSTNQPHWPIYRLTDIMLIKAEALARLNKDLAVGYKLCNQIFKRNNPALANTQATSNGFTATEVNYRLNDANATSKADDLLKLVYRERQREFIAEGKRWFDLVRQAEFSNDFNDVLTSFCSMKSNVVNRLNKLPAFYNPIYSEELKVNTNLTQNPVWDRYTKK